MQIIDSIQKWHSNTKYMNAVNDWSADEIRRSVVYSGWMGLYRSIVPFASNTSFLYSDYYRPIWCYFSKIYCYCHDIIISLVLLCSGRANLERKSKICHLYWSLSKYKLQQLNRLYVRPYHYNPNVIVLQMFIQMFFYPI